MVTDAPVSTTSSQFTLNTSEGKITDIPSEIALHFSLIMTSLAVGTDVWPVDSVRASFPTVVVHCVFDTL